MRHREREAKRKTLTSLSIFSCLYFAPTISPFLSLSPGSRGGIGRALKPMLARQASRPQEADEHIGVWEVFMWQDTCSVFTSVKLLSQCLVSLQKRNHLHIDLTHFSMHLLLPLIKKKTSSYWMTHPVLCQKWIQIRYQTFFRVRCHSWQALTIMLEFIFTTYLHSGSINYELWT